MIDSDDSATQSGASRVPSDSPSSASSENAGGSSSGAGGIAPSGATGKASADLPGWVAPAEDMKSASEAVDVAASHASNTASKAPGNSAGRGAVSGSGKPPSAPSSAPSSAGSSADIPGETSSDIASAPGPSGSSGESENHPSVSPDEMSKAAPDEDVSGPSVPLGESASTALAGGDDADDDGENTVGYVGESTGESANESGTENAGDDADQDAPEDGLSSSFGAAPGEQSDLDRNAMRAARNKLRRRSAIFGLDEEEVRVLAAAEMMFSDVFELMAESDPFRRIEQSEAKARARVQYSDLMIPPRDIDELLEDSGRTVRLNSKAFVQLEKSLPELMTALRGSAKILDQVGRVYAEQHALHMELLRLAEERRQSIRLRRQAAPSYLVDFARMLESLGCRRNDLRSVDGKVVRAIRNALNLDDPDRDMGPDGSVVPGDEDEAEGLRLQSWLLEGDLSSPSEDASGEDVAEDFESLSRALARSVMDGDLAQAADYLHRLQVMDGLVEDSFGGPDFAGLAEADVQADAGEDGEAGAGAVEVPAGEAPAGAFGEDPARTPGEAPTVTPRHEPALAAAPLSEAPAPSPVPAIPALPRFDFTGIGLFVPPPGEGSAGYERASGAGRVSGTFSPQEAFGGVISLAASSPEVIPMWAREDRRSERPDGLLGLADWYRFEVPAGDYALAQLPRHLRHYPAVTDDHFPAHAEIGRYAEVLGFDRPVRHQVDQFAAGRGQYYHPSLAVMRAAVTDRLGNLDEDLARFWLFLLVGRHHMDRIDAMFPHGFFHGVWSPDPVAATARTGFFRLVRVIADGDFADRQREIGFPPVRGKDTPGVPGIVAR